MALTFDFRRKVAERPKFDVIRAPTEAERAQIKPVRPAETIRRQQEAFEDVSGVGRVRIPFSREGTFAVPSPDPIKTLVTNFAARTPELVVSLPVAFVDFFKKNINRIVTGETKTTSILADLGVDPARVGGEKIIEDTGAKFLNQFNVEE